MKFKFTCLLIRLEAQASWERASDRHLVMVTGAMRSIDDDARVDDVKLGSIVRMGAILVRNEMECDVRLR